jgi:hypothetical protein
VLHDRACEGWVLHRRTRPIRHTFRYPVWMLYADVDRLAALAVRGLFGTGRLALMTLRPEDYPRQQRGDGPADIRAAVNRHLQRRGRAPAERVMLLTQPRSWGWLFNPVSFYFCFRGDRLETVLAEITNTPWNEVHTYLLDVDQQQESLEFVFPKGFHVSPFMPMDVEYRWRMKLDPDVVEIAMHLTRDGEETFFAGLYLNAVPVTRRALLRGALRYPLQNVRTLARIYWQAFRLWRKRTPFHAHPKTLEEVKST